GDVVDREHLTGCPAVALLHAPGVARPALEASTLLPAVREPRDAEPPLPGRARAARGLSDGGEVVRGDVEVAEGQRGVQERGPVELELQTRDDAEGEAVGLLDDRLTRLPVGRERVHLEELAPRTQARDARAGLDVRSHCTLRVEHPRAEQEDLLVAPL